MSEPHNHEKLTGAQNEAINKAWELLREHFEAVIIAYDTEAVTGTDRCQSWNYHGGLLRAIGLAEYVKHEALEEPESSQPD
jgi:hypothetical protein